MEEIESMPALIDTDDLASILGCSQIYAAQLCREGALRECARLVGGSWAINKAKALAVLGLA